MNRFASLYDKLDQAQFDAEKVTALRTYFREAPSDDAAWALYFLLGKRIRRTVSLPSLRVWAEAIMEWPSWMLDECQGSVGDIGETIHLLLPAADLDRRYSLAEIIENVLLPLGACSREQSGSVVKGLWRELDGTERFLLHKLFGGSVRFDVTFDMLALTWADLANVPLSVMRLRLSRFSEPVPESIAALSQVESMRDAAGHPYDFQAASGREDELTELGSLKDWIAEWKWEGLRVQVIRRGGVTCLWSRDGTVLNGQFPEIEQIVSGIGEGLVIDGELVVRNGAQPGAFDLLLHPLKGGVGSRDDIVVLMAFDLLEFDAVDIRSKPLLQRRQLLDKLLSETAARGGLHSKTFPGSLQGELFEFNCERAAVDLIQLSRALDFENLDDLKQLRESARQQGANGLVLKRLDSLYGKPRTPNMPQENRDWWNVKADPYSVSAVLVAAQFGRGKKADVYSEYSFAVFKKNELVTVARISGGLKSAEESELDRFIRSNIQGRHGPVKSVLPEHVFDLHYEGILESSRSRAGVSLRGARIVRWNREKKVPQVDQIEAICDRIDR